MKIAPLARAFAEQSKRFEHCLVHTGQHYDINMSQIFFDELELPQPDINLEVGSGSHAWQTAQIMQRFEPIVLEQKPDWVIVPGDVNSTIACALVCSKLGIKVAHLEAGLRSFDRTMPEEINRVLTDQISDLLLTPSQDADENLIKEGIDPQKIKFVGNIMIDTLVHLLPKAKQRWPNLQQKFDLQQKFMLVTLHRPSNVDDNQTLSDILQALNTIGREIKVLFPAHPRTRQRIDTNKLLPINSTIQMVDPVGYLDFLALQTKAALILTDSGGVQEETTYLGIPCLTARPNTERPVTISQGTNRLVASSYNTLLQAMNASLMNTKKEQFTRPSLWDGFTAKRVIESLLGNAF